MNRSNVSQFIDNRYLTATLQFIVLNFSSLPFTIRLIERDNGIGSIKEVEVIVEFAHKLGLQFISAG